MRYDIVLPIRVHIEPASGDVGPRCRSAPGRF